MRKHIHIFKRLINFWRFLSRPVKVVIFLAVMVLTGFFLYIFLDAPAFSDVHRYRRAEKANLVGPAKILDILEIKPTNIWDSYDRMLLADDGDGVIMYLWCTQSDYKEKLVYRDKMGEATVFAAPCYHWTEDWWRPDEINLPILVFDDYPQAVRAELDVTLTADKFDDFSFSKDYHLETTREKPGYFCFNIHATDFSASDDGEGAVLASFAAFTDSRDVIHSIKNTSAIPATVRLYNNADKLIYEETLFIRTYEGEAHYEKGELPNS